MNFFSIPKTWRIPETAMQRSIEEMAIDGAFGREGVAMWLGTYSDDIANISHVVVLRGAGVRKAPNLLMISADLINDLTDLTIEYGVTLIGQIHSHGRGYGTALSPTDKTYGIAVPGFLSVVAPDYAMRSKTSIYECGVHIFQPPTGWRCLSSAEVSRRIKIVRGVVPVLAAGAQI